MSEVISWKNAEHRNLDAYSGVEMGDESHLTRVEDVEALVALQAEEEGITDPVVTGHTYVRRTKHIYFGRGTEEAEGSSNCGTCDGGDCGSCKVLTYLTLRVRSAAVIAEEEAQHLRIRQEYEATHTKVECFLRDGKPVIREGKPQTRWIHNRDMREGYTFQLGGPYETATFRVSEDLTHAVAWGWEVEVADEVMRMRELEQPAGIYILESNMSDCAFVRMHEDGSLKARCKGSSLGLWRELTKRGLKLSMPLW